MSGRAKSSCWGRESGEGRELGAQRVRLLIDLAGILRWIWRGMEVCRQGLTAGVWRCLTAVRAAIAQDFERIILNRREQGTIAGLVLVSLAVMLASTVRWGDDVRYVRWNELVPDPLTHAIDLNLASRGELESLPGVGPALAARIVQERDERGRFQDVRDLRRVRGIGPKTIERLRPWICVEAELER